MIIDFAKDLEIDTSIELRGPQYLSKEELRTRTPRWLRNHPDAPLTDNHLEWYTGKPALLSLEYERPRSMAKMPEVIPADTIRALLGDLDSKEMDMLFLIFVLLIQYRSYLLELDLNGNPIHMRIFTSELTDRIANDPKVIDGVGIWKKIHLARLKRRTEVEWLLYLVAWRAWYYLHSTKRGKEGLDSEQDKENIHENFD
ncbi:hypothetical protein H072_2414 [Dactylellina haptotyla CBS 200.50]|uniref:Uncharacterized protein n=1 Tax=Dactylellina haptotyla (strain CBS 200.50) TaxID=1284197 RepID=S8AL14_DACHA|nr:hypothetical protein H072_2414 [Dactylellina haptotyla CBS 200.50]